MGLVILFYAASIIAVVLDSTSVCSVANADDSATFEWSDDKGTVTFSDNPMRVPDKYGKRFLRIRVLALRRFGLDNGQGFLDHGNLALGY